MILEYVSEKNNLIAISTAAEGDGLSDKLREGKINVKDGKDDIYWMIDTQIDGTAWIQINLFESSDIYEVEFTTNGLHGTPHVEWSLDGLNWYLLEPKSGLWTGYQDLRGVYVRVIFESIQAGFEFTDFKVFGDEDFEINSELCSLISRRYYPQRFFEKKLMIPEMVQSFMEMLERNDKGQTIKPWFEADCRVDVFLIFDEGEEGSGAINAFAIDQIPINSGSATTFAGFGAAIINRVSGGNAFYDIEGFMNPGITLRFNSTVDCDEGAEITPDTNYRWEFNDPYAAPGDPSTINVPEPSEVLHTFTALGYYDIKFVMTRNDRSFEGTQRLEITRSPYVISGPTNPVDSDVYKVFGLTKWPTGSYAPPIITDGTDVQISTSIVELVDNGDQTFTYVVHSPISGSGKIRIYDDFYDEWREAAISFD